MKLLTRILLPFIALTLSASAQTEAMLAKAREYLGGDRALQAVNSVRFQGKLTSTVVTGEGETREDEAAIEIVFAKPFFQRITINAPARTEVTALDDYEAWQRIENPEDTTQWRMTLLDVDQIRRLRANTWENLAFFGDVARQGGQAIDHGRVTVDGQSLHHITFDHGYGILFHRYFDPATGRLVFSETDTGARIKESGENQVAGVRFPGEVNTVSPRADGGSTTVRVVFDRVTVNESFPPASFRVPSIAAN